MHTLQFFFADLARIKREGGAYSLHAYDVLKPMAVDG
jgi:hypothetical protein